MLLKKKKKKSEISQSTFSETRVWKKRKKERKQTRKKLFQNHTSRVNIKDFTEAKELILIFFFFFKPVLYLAVFPLLQYKEGMILGMSQIEEISKLKS